MNEMSWMKTKEHFDWLEKCLNCWRLTEEFITQSIQHGKNIGNINICRDVAEMCSQCIKFEAQRSPFFQQLCELCAEMVESCASKLEEINHKDDICLQAIQACRTLAISSREVSQVKQQDVMNNE